MINAETRQMKVTTRRRSEALSSSKSSFRPSACVAQVDESVRHLSRRTKIPGFRPGKVPRAMLERELGIRRDDPDAENPIYDDAKEHLFEHSVLEARARESTSTCCPSRRRMDRLRARSGGATYQVTLPVRPDVKLGAYADYPFCISIDEINDESVDKVIEQLRDQQASLVPVEDRGAATDDYAVIKFIGSARRRSRWTARRAIGCR